MGNRPGPDRLSQRGPVAPLSSTTYYDTTIPTGCFLNLIFENASGIGGYSHRT